MKQRLPKRSEVPAELTWRLEDIYETEEAWEADLKKSLDLAEQLAGKAGHAAGTAAELLETMELYEECLKTGYRMHSYALLKHHEDTAVAENHARLGKAQAAETKSGELIAFLEPEILSLPEGTTERWCTELPELKRFEVTLKEITRQKAHTLDTKTEQILAASGEMARTAQSGFDMLQNADLKFPPVKRTKRKRRDSGEGMSRPEVQEIQITNGRFVPLQMSRDRALRLEVFELFYGRYKEFIHTFAALYEGQVKQQGFYAKVRNYRSAFEAAVTANNVDPAVCDRLISCVRRNLDKMHRYVRLRKRLLGVKELHMYDVYAPMVQDLEWKVTFEEAKEISLKALAPLGEDYIKVLREAYENRWVDVAENEGKRGGAYSTNVYGVHPYVLLNYNDTLDDVFVLVHEMGHSMHSWYSSGAQSFLNSSYRIFVAEVASTTNEMLLLEYLLKENSRKMDEAAGAAEGTSGPETEEMARLRAERAYLVNHLLESFKGTLYRQTMFEEFERRSNEMSERGEPLTAEGLSNLYLELNKAYFGPDMVSDPLIAVEWSRIPHFYYNFYVYQYATSFAAAVDISRRILKEGAPMVARYKEFLKSGCTDDPVSLLKIAGVDLSTEAPVEAALKVFEEAVAEMEKMRDAGRE
ncbi:MAG: oligoendopeptidase F family protein [Stomatobaculum sp.]|nr:oligoendopeptidase F family protein [Stomatobaculum sp.]